MHTPYFNLYPEVEIDPRFYVINVKHYFLHIFKNNNNPLGYRGGKGIHS